MIRNILLALFSVIAIAGCSNSSEKQAAVEQSMPKPVGDWSGELDLGALKLTFVFHIAEDSTGALSAKLDVLEQGVQGLAVDAVEINDGLLKLDMKTLNASFEGAFSGEEISGKFTQNGLSMPLNLKQGIVQSSDVLKRPQEPKAPFPYNEEEVSVENHSAGVTLSGTLTFPSTGGIYPVAILISGSGPNDRNETIFGHKPFLVLADHLTKQGIAVLRMDKRGVGNSTGDYNLATSSDSASDVLAAVDYLKNRKEVSSVGLIGHSEGGLIAPMASSQSEDIAFIVMMAGPGVNGEEILYRQGALVLRSFGEEVVEKYLSFQRSAFAILKQELDPSAAEEPLLKAYAEYVSEVPQSEQKMAGENAQAVVQRLNTPWFRQFLTFEPSSVLKQIRVPLLVLNGELDIQVDPNQNLPRIAEALQEAGNSDYTILQLPKLNHLFQTSETGSIAEYAQIEETIAPSALNLISDWILERIPQEEVISEPGC